MKVVWEKGDYNLKKERHIVNKKICMFEFENVKKNSYNYRK